MSFYFAKIINLGARGQTERTNLPVDLAQFNQYFRAKPITDDGGAINLQGTPDGRTKEINI